MGRDGVLLVQLGTPESTSRSDVRRYLREFLSDPRVLDMPAPARWLLLNAVILPFRPRRSAEQYEKIWSDEGSPLTIHTERLGAALSGALGDGVPVEYGMRYGRPGVPDAIDRLVATGTSRIIVVPLFPQYSSAAFGSAVEHTLRALAGRVVVPAVVTIPPFYDDPGFVGSVAGIAAPLLAEFRPDHVIFSYHGLPESQIRKADPTGDWCLAAEGCCTSIGAPTSSCYRAQCFATTAALADDLGLDPAVYSTSFQSRLAGQRWIKPHTDRLLVDLYSKGARRIAVLTPSFVADCLETIEEIGIRLRAQWEGLGGEELLRVPCVNDSPGWVAALADIIGRERSR
jgi:protoporphyrin/coproporphyrin ferrochelatase